MKNKEKEKATHVTVLIHKSKQQGRRLAGKRLFSRPAESLLDSLTHRWPPRSTLGPLQDPGHKCKCLFMSTGICKQVLKVKL